jgi:hypothetical protein
VTWDAGRPVGLDFYYDPVVDEHVGRGPVGLIIPTWYFAPQRREIAEAGWNMSATINGVLGDGPITGLDNPNGATMLLQIAGEFADPATKQRIWDAAEDHIEPTWDREAGEFTLGFGLNEPHPRGQLNARSMAGWVCAEGDWTRLFNEPNLTKFDEPTVTGVDFPRVALSEARWDGTALHLAAHPQNAAVEGTRTTVRITNVATTADWVMTRPDGSRVPLSVEGDHVIAELTVDNQAVIIRPG